MPRDGDAQAPRQGAGPSSARRAHAAGDVLEATVTSPLLAALLATLASRRPPPTPVFACGSALLRRLQAYAAAARAQALAAVLVEGHADKACSSCTSPKAPLCAWALLRCIL